MSSANLFRSTTLCVAFVASFVGSAALSGCGDCCGNVDIKDLPPLGVRETLFHWDAHAQSALDAGTLLCDQSGEDLRQADAVGGASSGGAAGDDPGNELVSSGYISVNTEQVLFVYQTNQGEYRITWDVSE